MAAAGIFAAACTAFVAASVAFVTRNYWRVPTWDHWNWLSSYYREGFAAALGRQYNEHRLVIPGFFYMIDQEVFAGSNVFLLAALLLAQGGCAFLLVRPLWSGGLLPRPLALTASGSLAASMFWFLQSDNLLWPFQFHTVFCGFCLLASTWAFAGLQGRGDGRANGRLAAACGFGVLATFSFANGILIWPVLLANGLAARSGKRTLWILAGCFLAALGGYLAYYTHPAHHAQPTESLGKPASLMRYMLLFLAMPVVGTENADVGILTNLSGYAAAAAGLALAAVLIAHHWLRRARLACAAETFYASLLMLSAGTVFLTSLGRINFPLQYVLASRYATVCLLFWSSLAALAVIHVSRFEASGGAGRAMMAGLLALATVSMLPSHIERANRAIERGKLKEQSALAMLAGVLDRPRIEETLVAPVDRYFVNVVGPMRKARRALFARPEASWIGAPVGSRFEVTAKPCSGFIDTLERLPAEAGFAAGARAGGWGWDNERGEPFERVIVAGERGEITGFGIGGQRREDVAGLFGNGGMKRSGWSGYTRLPGGRLTAYGLTRDGKACRIGERADR